MKLNELAGKHGATRSRKRVGRGTGSGLGETSGHGVKGQKSRSGVALGGFEGGQMPIHMRLPKRGFNNPFALRLQELTLGRLQGAIDAGRVDVKAPITAAMLKEAGVIRRVLDGVRLIGGGGALKSKITIEVAGASRPATAAVEQAGGTLVLPKPKVLAKTGKRHERRAMAAEKKKTRLAAEGGGKAKPAEKKKARTGGNGDSPEAPQPA